MGKTINQLFDEVKNSQELKKELIDVLNSGDKGKLQEWVKQQDCDNSLSEVKAFLNEKGQEVIDGGELTPEELENVAGGTVMSGAAAVGYALAYALGGTAICAGLAGLSCACD